MPYGDNFGFITIDWTGDDPRVDVQIRDEDGDATCGFKVRLSTLKGNARGAGEVARGRSCSQQPFSCDFMPTAGC